MKIKQLPEDFFVEEIINLRIKKSGEQTYFWLIKKNWTTDAAVREIARRCNVSGRRLKFAGSKDRIAVTKQAVSAFKVNPEILKNIRIKDITVEIIGFGDAPISLGTLKGNRFAIVLRDLAQKDVNKIKSNVPKIKKGFRNYFGEQRFGFGNTHFIGKAILQGNLRGAVKELLTHKDFRLEKSVAAFLKNNPNDFAGALRTLPKHIRKLYIHAYQSYLWNSALQKLGKPVKNKLPVPGYETKLGKDKFSSAIRTLLKKDGLDLESFRCRRMPELAVKGDNRAVIVIPKKLKLLAAEKDELNKNKFKIILTFELQKGSYATVLIDQLFK